MLLTWLTNRNLSRFRTRYKTILACREQESQIGPRNKGASHRTTTTMTNHPFAIPGESCRDHPRPMDRTSLLDLIRSAVILQTSPDHSTHPSQGPSINLGGHDIAPMDTRSPRNAALSGHLRSTLRQALQLTAEVEGDSDSDSTVTGGNVDSKHNSPPSKQ